MLNKKIYMTYKKDIPEIVFDRWIALNPDYKTEFSLDSDCIKFLKENFNDYIVNLFISIPKGMYKADLWRLCKLYIYGGVYADVDLVPHLNIDSLNKDITFYSCIAVDNLSIFQAFMINFSKPKNPLIFIFLLSFLMNNPYNYHNGPTYDMYNCIKYNLNNYKIRPNIKYDIYEVKINISIGISITSNKNIDLHYFPENIEYTIKLKNNIFSDNFQFSINNNILNIKRIDKNIGWLYPHTVDICIKSNESIYLFKECIDNLFNVSSAYVTFNSHKILDSRDVNYYNNNGW